MLLLVLRVLRILGIPRIFTIIILLLLLLLLMMMVLLLASMVRLLMVTFMMSWSRTSSSGSRRSVCWMNLVGIPRIMMRLMLLLLLLLLLLVLSGGGGIYLSRCWVLMGRCLELSLVVGSRSWSALVRSVKTTGSDLVVLVGVSLGLRGGVPTRR